MVYLEKVAASRLVRHPAKAKSFLAAAGIGALSALIFVGLTLRIMNFEMRKDEQLYVPPIRLLDRYKIYEDFFYNHTPGSAWLFYGIGKLTGSDHLLLTGRLGVLLGWIVLIVGIGFVSYALTRSRMVSWCIVILTVTNQLFLTQVGMTATNNLLPLPFSFLGLGLFVLGVQGDRARPFLLAAAGVLLSLAVSFKISAVVFILPVAIAAFLLPRSCSVRERLSKVVGPLAVGGLVGGLPVVLPLLSNPDRFLAHVIGYHLGPHLQYMRMPGVADEGAAMTPAAKLSLAHAVWFSGGMSVALVAMVALLLILFLSKASGAPLRREMQGGWGTALVVLAAAVSSVVLSFLPTPGFPQYFAPPLICLPLGFALLYARLDSEGRVRLQPALLASTIVMLMMAGPRLVEDLAKVVHPDRWTVMRVHESGVAIAERLAASGEDGKVATLAPVYALEGGLEVYPQLATGPFAYRTADITLPGLAMYYRMTSPTRIGALLESDPPAALLLGFDELLEQPMRAYAEQHGYVPVTDLGFRDRYGAPVLYLKPARLTAPGAS